MARKLRKFSLYKVTWIDAFSSNSWTDINNVEREIINAENKPSTLVGFYILSKPKFHVFTTGFDHDREDLFNYFAIPRTWIMEIKEIKQ
jgi:hypothetical protein